MKPNREKISGYWLIPSPNSARINFFPVFHKHSYDVARVTCVFCVFLRVQKISMLASYLLIKFMWLSAVPLFPFHIRRSGKDFEAHIPRPVPVGVNVCFVLHFIAQVYHLFLPSKCYHESSSIENRIILIFVWPVVSFKLALLKRT